MCCIGVKEVSGFSFDVSRKKAVWVIRKVTVWFEGKALRGRDTMLEALERHKFFHYLTALVKGITNKCQKCSFSTFG
jgi:hypothetical protein